MNEIIVKKVGKLLSEWGYDKISNTCRIFRKCMGISQAALGERCNKAQASVSQFEHGMSNTVEIFVSYIRFGYIEWLWGLYYDFDVNTHMSDFYEYILNLVENKDRGK